MATYLYDEAIVNKISNWTASTDIHVYGPNDTKRLFEVISDVNNDRPIELPVLCVRRKPGYNILESSKQPLSYDGLTLDSSIEKSIQLNAIKVQLEYQLDIYTRFYKEADEYVRNLIFNFINFPSLDVLVPYNGYQIETKSSIVLASEVEDNSDIPERFVSGQFTRFTLNISVPDAYLWDVRLRDNYVINPQVIIED